MGKITRRQFFREVPYLGILLVAIIVMCVLLVSTRHISNDTHDLAQRTNDLARKNSELVKAGLESHAALCILREDLARSVKLSKDFLDHPEIYPNLNTPAIMAATRASLRSRKSSLASLKSLECPLRREKR